MSSSATNPAEAPSPASHYWCFISYRHADNKEQDRSWASWLHQEIERYEVPAELVGTKNKRGDVLPERIYPVFRDEDSLPADAYLANSIVNALDRSRFVVVLCSPKAVESQYVAEEIHHFKKSEHGDRIIAAIISGEPGDPERECFPEPLRHPVRPDGTLDQSLNEEPIAADFRLKDGSEGFTSAEAYRIHLDKNTKAKKKEIRKLSEAYEAQLQLMK
ncbi:MAG: toll/interleukin-1 receptor domain-containing protein, partial [Verrucomicrobiota bacterium]